MVLKLVYLVAHDNVMATRKVLYINDIHILFFLSFFFSSFLDPAIETKLHDVG
jgi:hypothetical protein